MKRALQRIVLLAAAVAAASSVSADDEVALLRDRAPEDRPALLVLGSAHFANPGRDMINVEVDDVLSERRQAEIADVAEELAGFAPTRIAIEWPSAAQADVDDAYQAYLAGERPLGRGEGEQIGFRLAAMLGHERVYAVDWNESPPGAEEFYDWPAWAEANGQGGKLAAIVDPAAAQTRVLLGDQSVGAWLRALNAPERLAAMHQIYFDVASIGGPELQPGANWVGHWYARNLRIFGALVDIADAPEDRVLVVYGSGHAFLLRRFAEESGAFTLVDVEDVLAGE
ncbi:MAG: DUF5694 domain-containing protein [Maricaulaceae bacterium]|jgi:hypothetical protein